MREKTSSQIVFLLRETVRMIDEHEYFPNLLHWFGRAIDSALEDEILINKTLEEYKAAWDDALNIAKSRADNRVNLVEMAFIADVHNLPKITIEPVKGDNK